MGDMNLYLLRPVENHCDMGDDPWNPWYDKDFGHVVRADSEEAARKMCGSLGSGYNDTYAELNAWLLPKYSTCEVLEEEGEEDIIITDNHRA